MLMCQSEFSHQGQFFQHKAESRELAYWAYDQRYKFYRKKLNPERYRKLEDIGFDWIMHKTVRRPEKSKSIDDMKLLRKF
jgi:hypothetical protein